MFGLNSFNNIDLNELQKLKAMEASSPTLGSGMLTPDYDVGFNHTVDANGKILGEGWGNNLFKGIGTGLQAFDIGMNAYLGWKQLGIAQQQADTAEAAFNANKAMQDKLYNNAVKEKQDRANAIG